MEALQYIYTSWKNGDSTEKGYMIYSRSEGISESECTAIKDAMQYLAPKELTLTPTPQEIADIFPYAFSYFVLPTGRGCVAQSTYLGKDYSGRYGNYIIHALIFDINDLPCRPAEFFAEPYIKTAMTQEELDAPSPVPPLPPLHISEYASVINDEQLNEFLFDKEDEFAQLISMILVSQDAGIPFYLNDSRENLVLWAAAVQRILPSRLAKKFMFKKETERWKRILGWTCVYLVTAERSDQAAEELYKPIVRYLRSLDEDGLLDVVSKYKLLFFRFGPFNLVKTEKTKIKFTWLKTHGGQCVMYPSQTSTIKYKAYNLGGVIANAIIAALSTLLMLPNNFYLLMMMIELVFVGAYKILVNLIPHKTNGVPNDGYIVKMLDAHIAMRKDYALYLRIYADTFLNKAISPSDYQYERNESLSDDELLYYNEIQEILKSINAQMSKHEIDHCKGIVI